MAAAPTFDDFIGIGLATAQLVRNELLLDEGDVSHQLVAAPAAMADALVEHGSRLYRQTFLEGCTGQQLVERVTDRHKELVRKAESQASAELTFSRASAAAGAGIIPSGTLVASAPDSEGRRQEFETLANIFYSVAETGAKVVQAQAREAGSAGNVAVARISQFVSTVFDTTLTVTNAAAAAGGADDESDEEYRSRARDYDRTLVRGTIAAIELGARSVPGVRIARAREDSIGVTTVYVADAAGGSSQLLIDAVRTELLNWRAAGAVLSVVGGEVLLVDTTVRVRLSRGRAADVEGLVQVAVEQEYLKLSAGDVAYHAALVTAVMNLDRAQFQSAVISTPAADVEPEPHQIIRAGTITVVDA